MHARLLSVADIPNSLYERTPDTLHLSQSLVYSYRSVLNTNGLLERALRNAANGEIGGATARQAQAHFTGPFAGSCGRTALAILDPKQNLADVSDEFVRAFSGGRVGLLDIPCGAGAASITLLTTIAELRRNGVLPRQPLHVEILGGDISDEARNFATQMLNGINNAVFDQGITVSFEGISFDLLDRESVTGLLYTWMEKYRDCQTYFVLIANFSGFLNNSGRMKDARERIGEISRWADNRNARLVWIEPQTTEARNFWSSLRSIWTNAVAWFKRADATGCLQIRYSESGLSNPLEPKRRFKVRLSVMGLTRAGIDDLA